MPTYHIKLINDIAEIDPQQWNAVTGDTLHRGYRWQQYKQASQARGWPRAWTRFVTVWADAELVGVATAYQYPMPMPLAAPWLQRLSQIVLAPTNPINFSVLPMVKEGVGETAVFLHLLKGIRQLIWRRLALGTRLVFLDAERDPALLHHLRQDGYLINDGIWENELDLPWPSFAGYVDSLKSSHRNSLRKQQKKAARAGIAITTALPEDSGAVYALLQRVAAKNRSRLLYNPDFLDYAQKFLGTNHFKLFRALHQGQTVACLLMYHDQSTARLAAIGLDYDLSLTYDLYRNLIYAAIECCIDLGVQRVYGGMSRYDIKRRIGFVSRPTLTATYAWLPPVKKGYSFTPASLRDDGDA